jgi:hypothetical protein
MLPKWDYYIHPVWFWFNEVHFVSLNKARTIIHRITHFFIQSKIDKKQYNYPTRMQLTIMANSWKTHLVHGIEIQYCFGKDRYDNIRILDNAEPGDLWFHIADAPSAHLIVQVPPDLGHSKNRKMLDFYTTQGAVLCKQVSKYKGDKNVRVVCAFARDVTAVEKSPGTVTLENERVVTI